MTLSILHHRYHLLLCGSFLSLTPNLHAEAISKENIACFEISCMSGRDNAEIHNGRIPSSDSETPASLLHAAGHHGNPELARKFKDRVLPLNAEIARDISATTSYKKVSGVQTLSPRNNVYKSTSVSVINTDTITAVLKLIDSGLANPVILNLANKTIPGGGVLKGSTAQEESICRATTLYSSLIAAKNAHQYPLGEFDAMYSPTVLVHSKIDETKSFACISMAGYRSTAGRVDKADMPATRDGFIRGMEEKIRVILSTAIVKGHSHIVLGALGCGAFAKNAAGKVIPWIPQAVAAAFNKVLNENYGADSIPYLHHFENVTFAILERTPDLIPTFKAKLGITQGDSKVVKLDL